MTVEGYFKQIMKSGCSFKTTRLFQLGRRLFTSADNTFDVIVAGGGIVGASIASNLLKMSKGLLKIAIVDSATPPSLESCRKKLVPDSRVYALSPSSIKYLSEIGAWDHVSERSKKYEKIQVWESCNPSIVQFSAKDLFISELGSIVEDCTVQASIYESITEYNSQLYLLFGNSVINVIPSDKQPNIMHLQIRDQNQNIRSISGRWKSHSIVIFFIHLNLSYSSS